MPALEELVQRGYLAASGKRELKSSPIGQYGRLNLGQTTLNALKRFLDIDYLEAKEFIPEFWSKPKNLGAAKPDELIVQGRSVVAVVEHKNPGEVAAGRDRTKHLEQLQTYMLVCLARVGVLTDGSSHVWIHNTDRDRKNEIKVIAKAGKFYEKRFSVRALDEVIKKLNSQTDEISQPPVYDPTALARSIWQDVFIATRQDPEKCFQTFVEVFMYKLLSDYDLLPSDMKLHKLAVDPEGFKRKKGVTQIEYYLKDIRGEIKTSLFTPMTTSAVIDGLKRQAGAYVTTKEIISTLNTSGGMTSVINGHAFTIQPADYNGTFVRILRKLAALPVITNLDMGFKSRVYEQFLRRDPNITKVSGKYLTPRNVVKAIVNMADIASTHQDATICDPACGVGGFITESIIELEANGIHNFSRAGNGRIDVQRKFVGLEVLEDVVCLAKSNFLLHLIEFYSSLSRAGKNNFAKLASDIFIHCHEDRTLGALKHPCENIFDVIMANPPYIVSGTHEVQKKIDAVGLGDYYSAGGAGLESKFLNWIIKALKPGGRGFVILPKAMLARVNQRFKNWIRTQCVIDALIYLPERTFYTTGVETYILAVTKKHDISVEQHTPTFSYYIREIGETRDVKREPMKNDLIEMAREYRIFMADKESYEPPNALVKVLPVAEFSPDNRWDTDRFWTPQELAILGIKESRMRTFDSTLKEISETRDQVQSAKKRVKSLSASRNSYVEISLSDNRYFEIIRGKRITGEQCKKNPGEVPVVASSKHQESYLGTISQEFLNGAGCPIYTNADRMLTVGATGAVGYVHVRTEPLWHLHDDAIGIKIVHDKLLPEYVRYALQQVIEIEQFGYCAKLYTTRLSGLKIKVPTTPSGHQDTSAQKEIAQAFQVKEAAEYSLRELSKHLQSVVLDVEV